MRLYVDLSEDEELRNFIKGQVRAAVKSVAREDAKAAFEEAVAKRGGEKMESLMRSIIQNRVVETVGYQAIRAMVNQNVMEYIQVRVEEAMKDIDVKKLVQAEIKRRVGKVMD